MPRDQIIPAPHPVPTSRPGLFSRVWRALGFRSSPAPATPPQGALEAEPAPYRTGMGRRYTWTRGLAQGVKAEQVGGYLREADRGRPHKLAELLQELLDRDLHLVGVLNTRYSSVANLSWRLEAPEGDTRRRSQRIADETQATISQIPNLEAVLRDLLTAIYYGYSLAEIEWAITPEGRVSVAGLHHRPAWWFLPDPDDPGLWRVLDERHALDGRPLTPGRWLIHEARAKTGFPVQSGLGRPIVWWYLFKVYAVKDWASYAELFGTPFRLGKYDADTATPEDIDALHEALQQLGIDAAAAIPKGMEVEFIGDKSARSGPEVYQSLVTLCDRAISKGVLGQTLTTEEGQRGTQALGNVHNQVRADIRDADARQLARTLQRGLVEPLVMWNYGPEAPIPRFCFDIEPATDEKAEAEADKARAEAREAQARVFIAARDMGLAVPVEQAVEALGLRPAQGEEPILEATASALRVGDITSSAEIVRLVGIGEISRESGVELLTELVKLERAVAERIIGEAPPKPPAQAGEAQAMQTVSFQIPVVGPALVDWAAAYNAVLEVLGVPALEGAGTPHITVLHVGEVPEESVQEVQEAAQAVLEGAGEIELRGLGVSWFEPGEDGRTPIVIRYESPELEALNVALLRALAQWVSARQFSEFLPHATLGYLTRALRREEQETLSSLQGGQAHWRLSPPEQLTDK